MGSWEGQVAFGSWGLVLRGSGRLRKGSAGEGELTLTQCAGFPPLFYCDARGGAGWAWQAVPGCRVRLETIPGCSVPKYLSPSLLLNQR